MPCAGGGGGSICTVCEVKLPSPAALAQHRASHLHQVRLAAASSVPEPLDTDNVRCAHEMWRLWPICMLSQEILCELMRSWHFVLQR